MTVKKIVLSPRQSLVRPGQSTEGCGEFGAVFWKDHCNDMTRYLCCLETALLTIASKDLVQPLIADIFQKLSGFSYKANDKHSLLHMLNGI